MADQPPPPTRAIWLSRAVLALAWALVLIASILAGYRLGRPTDGWVITDMGDFAGSVTIFTANVLGEPPPIERGDRLLAVNGVPLPVNLARDGILPPTLETQIQPGATMTYTILRGGQTLDIAVPLKSWSFDAALAYRFADLGSILSFAGSWLLILLCSFVVLRRPTEPAARALLLFTTAALCNSLAFPPEDVVTLYSAVAPLLVFFNYLIWATLLAPSLLALTLTFPRPKPFVRRAPWLLVLPYLLYWLLLAALGPGVTASAGFGLSAIYFILALIATMHTARTARDQLSRAQLLWAVGGLLAILVGALPLFIGVLLTLGGVISMEVDGWLTAVSNVTMPIGASAFQVMIAIAILRYRLFDITVVIRRTLVYTALTLTLGVTYLLSIVTLQALFVQLTGQESTLAIVASTLAIAALFQPLRARVQAFIDRRFFRKRYDAQQVLAAFAQRAQQEADLDMISADILSTVQETLEPEGVTLWLAQTRQSSRARPEKSA